MFTLKGEKMTYSLNEKGQVASVVNGYNGHEYIKKAGEFFKLIYKEGDRVERPIFGNLQNPTITKQNDNTLVMTYSKLISDDRELEIKLQYTITMDYDRISVIAEIENNSDVQVMELQTSAISGVQSLSGTPEKDYIMWPERQGIKIINPAFSDLSVCSGFRKYERHDFLHTDLDVLYPGRSCMQWYDMCNENEGIYVGSHDESHQIICQHVERDVKDNTLRFAMIRYPFTESGEKYVSAPIVYGVHEGDWHSGSKIYRSWMETTDWKAPDRPDWAQEFQGWLRVILKTHHGEYNWTYKDIPQLFDQTQEAGLNTIFLLGWEEGGFARMWPDYKIDPRMGGLEELKRGIDYVHSKGGKVIMFLSYYLIDRQSDFYKKEGGNTATVIDVWGEEFPFSETYCGEGTYRKIPNQPMPMFAACSGSELWEKKMIESAKYCLDIGCDGVLYDLGGLRPILCFAKNHDHSKPNFSHASKATRYKKLREYVKTYGDDKIILMEHCVDIFSQSMDIIQPAGFGARSNFLTEFFRYTFPEIVMTNREMGQDEVNYIDNVNFTFIYGIAFDMTIYRCCGDLNDIPNYKAYLEKAVKLRDRYKKYFFYGKFIDIDGFTSDNNAIRPKAYRAEDGAIGVAIWNWSKETETFTLTNNETGKKVQKTMAPNTIDFIEL